MEKAIADLLQAEQISQAAECWQAEMKDLQFIDASENFVYAFEHQGRSLILRLTHSSHRHVDLVKGELDWIRHLHDNDVNVCMPVPSIHNRLVEVVPAHETYFIATVFERAPGRRATADDPQVWNAYLFTTWGETIGKMHALTKHYQAPDPAMKRPGWDEEELLINARDYLPSSDTAVLNLVDRCVDWLRELPRDANSYGLIHTDMHHWNFFVQGGKITVFDFDDCSYHWFIYDIAVPLYYPLIEIPRSDMQQHEKVVREFFTHFMDGYDRENRLNDFWFEHLHDFLKFRDVVLYIWCCKKYDLNNLGKQQAYFFNNIKANLEADMPCVPLDFHKLYCRRWA
jgi:amicoumacin kinase